MSHFQFSPSLLPFCFSVGIKHKVRLERHTGSLTCQQKEALLSGSSLKGGLHYLCPSLLLLVWVFDDEAADSPDFLPVTCNFLTKKMVPNLTVDLVAAITFLLINDLLTLSDGFAHHELCLTQEFWKITLSNASQM